MLALISISTLLTAYLLNKYNPKEQAQIVESYILIYLVIGLIILGIFLSVTQLHPGEVYAKHKWEAYSLFFVVVLTSRRKIDSLIKWTPTAVRNNYLINILLFFAIIFFIICAKGKAYLYSAYLIYVALIITFAVLADPSGRKEIINDCKLVFSVTLLCISSILTLTNLEYIEGGFCDKKLSYLALPWIFIVGNAFKIVLFRHNLQSGALRLNNALAALCAIALSLYSSFRSDILDPEGARYHWYYYVGPIETLESGGHLLWDTPSQYGLLNILASKSLDIGSTWGSFGVIQSIILFAIGLLIVDCFVTRDGIRPLRIYSDYPLLLALYLSDPGMIGPQSFPSSSVMRFGFVYILIWQLAFNKRSNPILYGCNTFLIWIMGSAWSFKSMVYCSSMTVVYALKHLIKLLESSTASSRNKIAALSTILLGAGVFLIYKFVIQYYRVDPFMFFEYALGYASGHGYVEMNPFGPIVFGFILTITLVASYLGVDHSPRPRFKESLIILILAFASVFTYYIGRPVPQNFTAIMPIVLFIAVSGGLVIKNTMSSNSGVYYKAISLVLIFIVCLPVADGRFLRTISHLKSNINLDPSFYKTLMHEQYKQKMTADIPSAYFSDSAYPFTEYSAVRFLPSPPSAIG